MKNKGGRPRKHATHEERLLARRESYKRYNKKRRPEMTHRTESEAPKARTRKVTRPYDKKRAAVERQWKAQRDKTKVKEPKFQTKVTDYSQMVSVKVDARTTIMIHKDADPQAAIAAYKARKSA